MSNGELLPGWKRDYGRGMLHDETGRFRIYKSQPDTPCTHYGSCTCYLLEDRKKKDQWVFERQEIAMQFAEKIKKDDAHSKWVEERKKKVGKQVEFRHVTSSGGFYYWKNAADRKAEREARYDNFPHAFGRVTDSR